MAFTQLAIKGHATRGKEVIQLLEMLDGVNYNDLEGTVDNCLYYICNSNEICHCLGTNVENVIVYTLEEFLEKYPYKVGDKVEVRETGKVFSISNMIWEDELSTVHYGDMEDIVYYTADELKPYKEEIPQSINLTQSNVNEIEVVLGDYEFVLKDGKTYFVKKKPKYPQNYKECCSILGFNDAYDLNHIATHDVVYDYKLRNFYRLFICRNAYWKIAGEELGLDKPWEQDYNDRCFIIANNDGNIHTYEYHGSDNVILAFPTKEMRDAFYKNFKDLIEQCKELL